MGWNTVIKPNKGYLAGKLFTYSDITGDIIFANTTDNYSNLPTMGDDEHGEFSAFIGYHTDNFGEIVAGMGQGTDMLLAGWNVNPQGGDSGVYVCLLLSIENYTVSSTEVTVRLTLKLTKRLYDYAGTHYTEHFPVGTYFPATDYTLWSANAPDNRQGNEFAFFFKTATFNGVENYVLGIAQLRKNGYAYCYCAGCGYRIKKSYFTSSDGWGSNAEPQESAGESEEFGTSAIPKGGYNEDSTQKGAFDDSSDTITLSNAPTLNAGVSGYFHAYFVTETDMLNIGKAIFPEPFISSTDIIQSMNNLIVTFWNSKKIDCILDCLILPIAVPFGTKENIKCGGSYLMYYTGSHESFVEGFPVTQYYVDFSCGKLSLDEYWANFLDFTGTRIKIFIPAVGYVDLQTEYLNGGEIELKYRFNIVDGSFMAYIISTSGHSNLTDSVIAQYSGVWAMHIPLTAQDNSNKVSGLISAVGAVTAGAMTGGASMGLGAVSSLGNTMIQKPTTVHANGYNASSSFLTHRKPYVIIERQSSQFSEIYPSENGLPWYVAMPLSQVRGFTIIENPVLNIDCNDEEYNEICNLLKSGVIF